MPQDWADWATSRTGIFIIIILVLVLLLWYNKWKIGEYDMREYVPGWESTVEPTAEGMLSVQPAYGAFLSGDRLKREGMLSAQPAYSQFASGDRLQREGMRDNRYYLGGY